MRKSFKYRIYPNKEQETLIQKTFGCVRFVYNHFLEKSITEYRNKGQRWSRLQQDKALTILKKELVWLREPDKCALQNSLRDLDDAYQSFFRKVKCGDNPGFPKFKSKKKEKKSYKTSNNGNSIRLGKNEIHFLKLGWVKAKITRDIPQGYRPISATISQDPSGKYYAAIVTEYEFITPEIELDMDNALGLDYSSPHFYVDSEGDVADMPHFYRDAEKRLARERRKLSKMVKGSNNYQKQKIKVARAYEKVRFCRSDWQHKESTRLANQYDYICVEGINYQDMGRGLHLAKATNDNAFGQFRQMLTYKMAERGKKLITIDKWYPSSKTCRFCGNVCSELTLKDREWTCPSCGAHIDRDLNAAINIRNEGLANVS